VLQEMGSESAPQQVSKGTEKTGKVFLMPLLLPSCMCDTLRAQSQLKAGGLFDALKVY
jgi:hypothetical protein